MLLISGSSLSAVSDHQYARMKMKESTWLYVKTSTLTKEMTIIECGISCAKRKDECNVLKYQKETKICTLGFVSKNKK